MVVDSDNPRARPASGMVRPAQFFIDEREQFLSGLGVVLLDGVEDAGHIAHRR